MPRRARIALVLISGAISLLGLVHAADPFPGQTPGTDIGQLLPFGFEPSGAVWHPGVAKLLVVDDGGVIARLPADGSSIDLSFTSSLDVEGVCIADFGSDFIYLAGEYLNRIFEFDLSTGQITRNFDLGLTPPSNGGIEAVTFVPDPDDVEGGLFYVGVQHDGSIHVFRLAILTSSVSTPATAIRVIPPISGRNDLSGLHYDRNNGLLYAIWDSHDLMAALELDGTVVAEWELPGSTQEGIAIGDCSLFIAEDHTSQVWRYAFPLSPEDLDEDAIFDCADNCLDLWNPLQVDTDEDAQGDACDEDDDSDGIQDTEDNCPLNTNPFQLDLDGDGAGDVCDDDDDDDDIVDVDDNCPRDANIDQTDTDLDGMGDVCDPDDDGDGIPDADDNCPLSSNVSQEDLDQDGLGDVCDPDNDDDGVPDELDVCPDDYDPMQPDVDDDGIGDICDACPWDADNDVDGDGICGDLDVCPGVADPEQTDTDQDGDGDLCDDDDDDDGWPDTSDNCPLVANASQFDGDHDNFGDACDCAPQDASAALFPGEIEGLVLEQDAATGVVWLVWSPQLAVYDVVWGTQEELAVLGGVEAATCLSDDLLLATIADSTPDPAPAQGFYFVVRAQNVCGVSGYGVGSSGDPREPQAGCP